MIQAMEHQRPQGSDVCLATKRMRLNQRETRMYDSAPSLSLTRLLVGLTSQEDMLSRLVFLPALSLLGPIR